RNPEVLADPVGEREVFPALDLIRSLDSAPGRVHRTPEADAHAADRLAIEPGFRQQRGGALDDLFADAGGPAGRIDGEAPEGADPTPTPPDPELELGPADLDPEEPRVVHGFSALRHRRWRGSWRRSADTGRR